MKKDRKKWEKWFEQKKMSYGCFLSKIGLKKKAFLIFKDMAKKGNPHAQFNLGVIFETGAGVPKSAEDATYWYERSAVSGCAEAQIKCTCAFFLGTGTERNFEKALRWSKEASKQGESVAQTLCGILMLCRAKSLFQSSYEGGFEDAEIFLQKFNELLGEEDLTDSSVKVS